MLKDAIVAMVRRWRTGQVDYEEKIVPFNITAEQIEAARRLVEKERAEGTKPIPR